MKPMLGMLAGLALAWSACGPAPEKTAASDTNSTVGQNPLNAPAEYLGGMSKAKNAATRTVDLAAVTRAVQAFQVSEGRNPRDLNELVTEDYLPRLPALPAGLKYAYDPATGQVRTAPQ